MSHVLLAGESWSVTSIHAKGFDTFTTVDYAEGGQALIDALESGGHDVTYMPSHIAASRFPYTREELDAYDVVVLSDIGANTLLLPGDTFIRHQPRPNRLSLLRDWVLEGGALAMVGGYLTFQGIEAKANYRATAVAEILPVEMESGDDRHETPEGVRARVTEEPHPIIAGLSGPTPPLLGYQRLTPRPDSRTLLSFDEHPLLVVGEAGKGRTLAYASDIGPHWAPEEFTSWEGFSQLWQRSVAWLAQEI